MGQSIPPEWGLVLAILGLFFAGGSGIVWAIRRDIRESRSQLTLDAQQKIANDKAQAELSTALQKATQEAVDGAITTFRELLSDTRAEVVHAREEADRAKGEAQNAHIEAEAAKLEAAKANQLAAEARTEAAKLREAFRLRLARIETLLRQNQIGIPDWWHDPI